MFIPLMSFGQTIMDTLAAERDAYLNSTDRVIPFELLDRLPIIKGCKKNLTREESTKCFQEQIEKIINENFVYPERAQELGIQGTVYCNFKIGIDGVIKDIIVRGPDQNLQIEAYRILKKIPKMKPALYRGRNVVVQYNIPIAFSLK
jgi:periplasmic protein TonB